MPFSSIEDCSTRGKGREWGLVEIRLTSAFATAPDAVTGRRDNDRAELPPLLLLTHCFIGVISEP
jgi:hypothetical protein